MGRHTEGETKTLKLLIYDLLDGYSESQIFINICLCVVIIKTPN